MEIAGCAPKSFLSISHIVSSQTSLPATLLVACGYATEFSPMESHSSHSATGIRAQNLNEVVTQLQLCRKQQSPRCWQHNVLGRTSYLNDTRIKVIPRIRMVNSGTDVGESNAFFAYKPFYCYYLHYGSLY